MAQDFDSNLSGVTLKAAIDTKIKGSLDALRSSFLGGTAPTTTVAGMLWADTSSGILKIRNATNTAWIEVAAFGQDGVHVITINKGTASSSFTYYFGKFFSPAEIVGCTLVTHPSGTSDASNYWSFQVHNLTQSLDLLATPRATWIGSADDPVEDTPYEITPDQNATVSTGDVLEFQATETGTTAPTLTETCVQLFYKPR